MKTTAPQAHHPTVTPRVEIPAHSGDVVAVPHACTWTTLARANRTAADAWSFTVAGMPAAKWRREGRQELWSAACAATAEIDGTPPRPQPDRPHQLVLGTGHQPEFFHPGVWIKELLIDAVCRAEGVGGLNVIVDHDLPDASRLPVPEYHGQAWRRSWVALPGMRNGLPWESQPPLGADQWRRLLGDVEQKVLKNTDAATCEALDACRRFSDVVLSHRPVLEARNLAESVSRARRAWEATEGRSLLLELPASRLSSSRAFFRFAAEILSSIDRFWHAYNESLRVFRARHGIRSQANPVPDLRRRDDLWETPFWCLHPSGERRGLFARGRPGQWLLQSKDSDLLELPADPLEASLRLAEVLGPSGSGFAIRPRALMLTMFMRMVACDLFVHGMGGVHYEGVGDEMLQRFWGIAPIEFAAASATLHPDLDTSLPHGDDPRALRRRLRDLQWNPQRFLSRAEGDAEMLRALARRKEALAAELREQERGQRARATREIRAVNRELSASLVRFRQGLELRLARAREGLEERRALTSRDYPFFLFDPARVRALAHSSPADDSDEDGIKMGAARL